MLENEFQHGKIGFWKSFDQFAQLQNFDASIGNHYGEKYGLINNSLERKGCHFLRDMVSNSAM